MTTRVIVPVRNQWNLTRELLLSLDPAEFDAALILDNGSTDITATAIRSWQRQDFRGIGKKIKRTFQPDRTIYELWNHGFEWAARGALNSGRHGERYVLVTNNDVELPPGALEALRAPLRALPRAWASYPDYTAEWSKAPVRKGVLDWFMTRGVLSDGGLFGACFMLAAHKIPWRPLITDLSYEWWYGDNHLAEEIDQHGGAQIRVIGLPVLHVNEGTASKLDPSVLYGMKYRDRHRWITRYERTS